MLDFIFRNAGRTDKFDSSFQRSRSSSMSSLENISTETISCLTFADSYTKKSGIYDFLLIFVDGKTKYSTPELLKI